MKVFIKVPVDPGNLPKGETIAFDKHGQSIVGWIQEDNTGKLDCHSEESVLERITHYLKEVDVPDEIILNHLK